MLPSEMQSAPWMAQRTWGSVSSVSAFLQKRTVGVIRDPAVSGFCGDGPWSLHLKGFFQVFYLFCYSFLWNNKCLYGKKEDKFHLPLLELFIEEQLSIGEKLYQDGGSS